MYTFQYHKNSNFKPIIHRKQYVLECRLIYNTECKQCADRRVLKTQLTLQQCIHIDLDLPEGRLIENPVTAMVV
jgi:hypothetical protein